MSTTLKIKKEITKAIKKEKQVDFLSSARITKNNKMSLVEIRKSLWK